MFKKFSKRLFKLIPPESALIYKIACRYVDCFNSDNNSDFFTNGEARLLRTVLHEVSRGVIFDVGANIGEWSHYCLSIAHEVEVHLFEPSAVTYQKLKADSWPPNSHLNNFGLGERNEILQLNIFDDGSGLNSLYPRRGIGEHKIIKTEEVRIRTIDEYCEECGIQQIEFMKVDVEGHELSVFKGTRLPTSLPPPLWGGPGWGVKTHEGPKIEGERAESRSFSPPQPPHPNPSPRGGGNVCLL
ncbi:MAG: FkbM family methyltransferase [Candidatus Competibacteraceae bacterium]